MAEEQRITVSGCALGPYQTNCYLVARGGHGFLVDCGFDPGPLLDRVDALGVEIDAIVLTHAHLDHIAGLHEARRRLPGVPIWIHEAEEHWLLDAEANLSALAGMPVTGPPADRLLHDGQVLELIGTNWDVLHTPGHSPGGVTLYHSATGVAFVGDALFAGSIGRTDFPGSSFETLERSIRQKLYTLPDETRIFPGHGEASTIGVEKNSNPFVNLPG